MKAFHPLLAVTVLGQVALPALAGLGRAPLPGSVAVSAAQATQQASVAKKAAASPSASQTTSSVASPYTLQAQTLASGTVVTEYLNAAGIVFAVTWAGPVLPDLTALLGDYFPTFKTQTAQRRAAGWRGGPVQVAADGLTLVSAGRMGHFSGYAYAASLVPAGVDVATLLQGAP